jgi:hypothetical protein
MLPRARPFGAHLGRVRDWGPQIVLVAALAFLCWCTLTAIERPGMEYDEPLFVNAALGGHYPNFIASRFLGVPTVVMPYSGALKSWLYAPVFEFFGVSVTTIRAPAVLILVATVLVAFAYAVTDAVRRTVGGVDHVMTADWGFGNQLFALGGDDVRRRLDDTWSTFAFGTPESIDQLATVLLRGQRSVLLLHEADDEQIPGTHRKAEAMLRRLAPASGVEVLYRGDAMLAYVVDDRRPG